MSKLVNKLNGFLKKFGKVLEYNRIDLFDFDLSNWTASSVDTFVIKQVGKKGFMKRYELTVSGLDRNNPIKSFNGYSSTAREFSVTLGFESLLSINTLSEVFSNCDEFGFIKDRGMVRVKKGDKRYILNYTCPESWSYSCQKGFIDLNFAEVSRTVAFETYVPCVVAE